MNNNDRLESKIKSLIPSDIDGRKGTLRKHSSSGNDDASFQGDDNADITNHACNIVWSQNDHIAYDYVPEEDRMNDPLKDKKIPQWLIKKGFRVPFEVESVFDGERGKIHYSLTGPTERKKESRLVLCFHGINGNREIFEQTHRYITENGRHYVLSLDLYGHGLSENVTHHQSRKTYGLEFFCKQVNELLDHLQMRDFQKTLVGFSMGALIAIALAIAEPETVERIYLIGPAFYVDKPRVVDCVKGCECCIKCVNPCCAHRCLFRKQPELTGHRRDHDNLILFRRATLQMVVKGSVVDSFLGCVCQLPMWDASELLEEVGKLSIPTLILWGRHDNVANISMAEKVVNYLPNSHLIVLPKTKHLVPAERVNLS
eukprot:GHVH01008288.1.p1 GENE.GHVH01008288.1~~GHVH01008288.1.p1  ORF type:complete len:372 (+),score=39.18 GHVH01008288.1:36-1151(+)